MWDSNRMPYLYLVFFFFFVSRSFTLLDRVLSFFLHNPIQSHAYIKISKHEPRLFSYSLRYPLHFYEIARLLLLIPPLLTIFTSIVGETSETEGSYGSLTQIVRYPDEISTGKNHPLTNPLDQFPP